MMSKDLLWMFVLLFWSAVIGQEAPEDPSDLASVIACSGNQEGDLRVQGAVQKLQNVAIGHVEICHNRTWGVICANNWDINEAAVACRQLGFLKSERIKPITLQQWRNVRHNYSEGQGPRTPWLDNVYCQGTERYLIDCRSGYSINSPLLRERYGIITHREVPCFESLEIVGVVCTEPVGVSTTRTVVLTATTVAKSSTESSSTPPTSTFAKLKTGISLQAESTATNKPVTTLVPNNVSTHDTQPFMPTSVISKATNVTGTPPGDKEDSTKTSNTLLVPFMITAVVIFLLIFYIARMLTLAINLRIYCQQVKNKLVVIEQRTRELPPNTKREQQSRASTSSTTGADIVQKPHPTAVSAPLSRDDHADGLYSKLLKPDIHVSQATSTDNAHASTDTTYSKPAPGTVVSMHTDPKTSLDVHCFPHSSY